MGSCGRVGGEERGRDVGAVRGRDVGARFPHYISGTSHVPQLPLKEGNKRWQGWKGGVTNKY